jgi:hypothetical protein
MANLEDCKPNLKKILMKLIGIIALYTSHSETEMSCQSLKAKRSNKMALSTTLANYLMTKSPIISIQDFCLTMTLVRPSWLAALVMITMITNGKHDEFKLVGDMT